MSLSEFAEGAIHVLCQQAFISRNTLRRELNRSDFKNPDLTRVRNEVSSFWNVYGEDILAATFTPPSWPGSSPMSRHAGAQYALCRNRLMEAFDPGQWGTELASAMTISARAVNPVYLQADTNGNITIVVT